MKKLISFFKAPWFSDINLGTTQGIITPLPSYQGVIKVKLPENKDSFICEDLLKISRNNK